MSGRAGAAALLLLLLLSAQTAMAQRADEPPPPQSAPSDPDVIGSIGRFFEQGANNLREHLRGAHERAGAINQQAAAAGRSIGETAAEVGKGAVDVTRSAVDAVVKLPTARVIQGRQICEVAPNGAPDCQTAAETLCRGKGFAGGKSMDFTSAQKCPARVWAAGREANVAECTTETFISRAMCQ